MPTTKPPTTELGAATDAVIGLGGGAGAHYDAHELNPRLAWPQSIPTYEGMLNDSQVEALRAAVTLPQRRRRWMIDPNGASARLTKHVASDLGLPVKGAKASQSRLIGGFSWQRHLFHVLLAPYLGFYPFEQVGEIAGDGLWHLRKLAPRPPRTVQDIEVAADGGLKGIRQNLVISLDRVAPLIPVDRLAMYVWEQEAGNWTGRSMLRGIYREWLAKDQLLKVDVVKHQRNGMGIPMARSTTPDGDRNLAAAHQVAAAARVGQEAAAGLPYGTDIDFKGVQGALPDTLASIRYHDEAMARRFLAMFLQLGQTETGSRALGDSFIDFFALAEDATSEWVCDTTTLHVIADIAQWNYGIDPRTDPIPMLVSERAADPADDIADLAALVAGGLVTVDAELEDWVRQQKGLPNRPETVPPAGVRASRQRRRLAAGTGNREIRLPDRPLRREPFEHEVRAAIDFETIELAWEDGVEALLKEWAAIRTAQVDDLVSQIKTAGGNLDQLAAIQAETAGVNVLLDRMRAVAAEGIATALDEAAHQGVNIPRPDVDAVMEALAPRAEAAAQLLARSLSEAAARRAVSVTGGALLVDDVADDVRGYIETLTDTWLRDQFTGLLTQAMNTGRRETIAATDVITKVYASALLDSGTCASCLDDDGREFSGLMEAELQFPTGGNKDCQGGPRCRCTLVAIYDESEPTVR